MNFRQLSDQVWASPQITHEDVSEAAAQGFTLVVNNRPDGEAPEQPSGAEIERATRAAGMEYLAIPITPGGFSETQVLALEAALKQATGPVLAYCRSGTRSTLLWALARAKAGDDTRKISASAAQAGYDVSPVQDALAYYGGASGSA